MILHIFHISLLLGLDANFEGRGKKEQANREILPE
jgi:hypothetical protein